jgi:large subunit ribosomal protein L30
MAEKKVAKKADCLTITMVKGLSGRTQKQIAVAHSLGLKRPGDVTVQPDNGPTQGKIAKIAFLLKVSKG